MTQLNIRQIRLLQAFFKANPDRFDMRSFAPGNDPNELDPRPSCGTAGCIAGWTVALACEGLDMPEEQIPAQRIIVAEAAKALGLINNVGELKFQKDTAIPENNDVVLKLFFVDPDLRAWHLSELSADDAIAALDALIETGEPKWPIL